jgi:hypothetical protein
MAFKNFKSTRRGSSVTQLMREASAQRLPVHAAIAYVWRRMPNCPVPKKSLAVLYKDLTTPLGETAPDDASKLLGTRYDRFSSPAGIDGLARETGGRLDILAAPIQPQPPNLLTHVQL